MCNMYNKFKISLCVLPIYIGAFLSIIISREKEITTTFERLKVDKMKEIRKINIEDLKAMNVSTFSKKDNSPRGVKTESIINIKVGDKVVLDNYFTLVTA